MDNLFTLNSHEGFMSRAIELAKKGHGNVSPNPMVGCVIVYDGEIIGEGYHNEYGKNHAEVNAINSVKDKSVLKNSILYVNLEPCCHHGKTPPCVKAIAKSKVKNVFFSINDPDTRSYDKCKNYLSKKKNKCKTRIV